ncbi:MAG TPA: M67 family metallopeptidase [Vicinamibacterales bacterium]|nr:M67 family metallopeptidase [Vicinamibacterales bacterium]
MTPAVRQAIVAHARAEAPHECCGLLVGSGRRIDVAVPLSNVDPRPRVRFRVDPAEHIAVRRIVRRLTPRLAVIGVYHSHPQGPATPSPRDMAECHYPDWIFVIVGRRGRSVRAYQLRRNGPAVVPIILRTPRPVRRRR